MKEECRRATERTESQERKVDGFFSKLLEVQNGKVDLAEYNRDHSEIHK